MGGGGGGSAGGRGSCESCTTKRPMCFVGACTATARMNKDACKRAAHWYARGRLPQHVWQMCGRYADHGACWPCFSRSRTQVGPNRYAHKCARAPATRWPCMFSRTRSGGQRHLAHSPNPCPNVMRATGHQSRDGRARLRPQGMHHLCLLTEFDASLCNPRRHHVYHVCHYAICSTCWLNTYDLPRVLQARNAKDEMFHE